MRSTFVDAVACRQLAMGVDGVGHQASRGRGLSLALAEYWRYVVHGLQGGWTFWPQLCCEPETGFHAQGALALPGVWDVR
jgi:hypothetical protein